MGSKLVLNADGTVTNYTSSDVEPIMDLAKSLRDEAPMLGSRYKSAFTLGAIVPAEIVEKIKNEKGVNFFDKNDRKRFWQIIQTDFPVFMTLPGKVLTGKARRGRI